MIVCILYVYFPLFRAVRDLFHIMANKVLYGTVKYKQKSSYLML